ncbi:MAG: radical SAM family RiPP maturation amino acid epimerase [Cyanobacteria bacterium P01_A01_bin.84]
MNQKIDLPTKEVSIYDEVKEQDLSNHFASLLKDTKLKSNLIHIKRFYERYNADNEFREQLFLNPHDACQRYKLQVDPEEIRPIWDEKYTQTDSKKASNLSNLEIFSNFYIKTQRKEQFDQSLFSTNNYNYKLWRQRQIARTLGQLKKSIYDDIVHAPTSFELSKGCSVGCWFCGVSAPRLGDIFTYNDQNAQLWHEVLEVTKDILGTETAGKGFCYWATDPLDNPNYEEFCNTFYETLGIFPQTTTAQPLKDIERTRALLKLSQEKGCELNRFSIISLKIFNQVHENFTAEELAQVDLVLQNPEAMGFKADAGRSRDRKQRKAEKHPESIEDSPQTTIACVSGFLFSMVDRSVKLISPCPANERWKDGYIIYDEGTFCNANDLKSLLEGMIEKHMPTTVRYNDVIRFRHDLKYESLSDGFQVSTRYLTSKFRNQPYLKDLGEIIQKGDKTTKEIVLLLNKLGVAKANTLYYLNILFSKGLFDEEAQFNSY